MNTTHEEGIILNHVECSMLAEVAEWHRNAPDTFTLTKLGKAGMYSCNYGFTYNGSGVQVELTPDEAAIFNRHVTCPASLADLVDLPARVRRAKLLALIS